MESGHRVDQAAFRRARLQEIIGGEGLEHRAQLCCQFGIPEPVRPVEVIEQRPGTLRVAVDGNVRSLRPDCGQKVWMAV